MVVFAIPPFTTGPKADEAKGLIREVGKIVKDGLGGWDWDGVGIAVGVGEGTAEDDEWDELCAEGSLEFVRVGGKQAEKNEFGGLSPILSCSSLIKLYLAGRRYENMAKQRQRKRASHASRKP